jgi:Flp pilus assembly pilin Flp
MIETAPRLLYGFSWAAAIADGLIAALIATAILIAMTTLGSDIKDPIGMTTTHATAARPFA